MRRWPPHHHHHARACVSNNSGRGRTWQGWPLNTLEMFQLTIKTSRNSAVPNRMTFCCPQMISSACVRRGRTSTPREATEPTLRALAPAPFVNLRHISAGNTQPLLPTSTSISAAATVNSDLAQGSSQILEHGYFSRAPKSPAAVQDGRKSMSSCLHCSTRLVKSGRCVGFG